LGNSTSIFLFLSGFFIGYFYYPLGPFYSPEPVLNKTPEPTDSHQQIEPILFYPKRFFSVTGRMNGNPFPNSAVFLYAVSNTNSPGHNQQQHTSFEHLDKCN